MLSLCVFCGSKPGQGTKYQASARELGKRMAAANIRLIFGGGHLGLMGAVSDSIMEHQGSAVGIIPEKLVEREQAHSGVTELITVANMHERKAKMYELADAFVALPGGLGTMDEFFEVFTWKQIGYHQKPLFLLNLDGYFDPLVAMLDRMVEQEFTDPEVCSQVRVVKDVDALVRELGANT